MFGSGKTRITSLLTNLRLASVEFKEKDMKLISVYKSNFLVSTFIFKFIYKRAYLYTTENKLTYGTSNKLDIYKKVPKRDKYETIKNI